MSPTLPPRTFALRSLLAVGAALGLAACGGSKKPAPAGPSDPGGGGGGTELALGTSGMPGLDWGANAAAITQAFPRVTPTEGGLWATGMTHGHSSITKFTLGDAGLTQVDIEWTEGYVSMADCANGWNELRATLDQRLGASKSDNLAAYWDLPAASVVLACNPNDVEAGVLSLVYAPRTDE